MMSERKNALKDKSFDFALDIVKLVRKIQSDHKEYVLTKQLLRSGTNPGAMTREAEFAQSKADFINKLSVGLKEMNETLYWLQLLEASGYITPTEYEKIKDDGTQILRLLVSSINTSKSR